MRRHARHRKHHVPVTPFELQERAVPLAQEGRFGQAIELGSAARTHASTPVRIARCHAGLGDAAEDEASRFELIRAAAPENLERPYELAEQGRLRDLEPAFRQLLTAPGRRAA
jgi:hypothetical protein